MIVLDTQAWLWWLHDPSRLSARARQVIARAEGGDGMTVSAISVWEVATKCAMGKLVLPMPLDAWFALARAYQGNAIKRISSKPKGYLTDTGLACHLSRITSPSALGGHPMAGALFETAIVSEIRKLQSAMSRKAALHYWRMHGGSEIDLILERDGVLYPIKIKLASRPTRNDARGFVSLRASYPRMRIAPGLVLAPAESLERLADDAVVAPYDMV